MKAEIISTSHTIGIDNTQIDIFYFFVSHTMEVYANGILLIHAQFHPSRIILSYTNVIDIASLYYEIYIARRRESEKREEIEAQVRDENKKTTVTKKSIL